jgi:hypothetical protein
MASRPVFIFCAPGLVFGGTGGRQLPFSYFALPDSLRRYGGRQVPFLCFALRESFLAVPSASGPVFMFCTPGIVFIGTGGDGSLFLVLRPGLVFGNTEGVESRFHVLRSRNHFRQYRGRRVLFSCFARPKTQFWWYRGRQVPFSCFVLRDSFSAVPSASGPIFIFCAPGLVFGRTGGDRSLFLVLLSRTRLLRYGGRWVIFSCFVLPESFTAVPSASGPVFMFCSPGIIFVGTGGVGSLFYVLRPRTCFRQYRGRRVPFSCFALPEPFSAVPRASGPFFLFCAHKLVFGGTEGVGSRFHVLRSRTHFRRYRGRPIPFSCFARTDSYSAVSRALGPVFMFCAPRHIFIGVECVGSSFHDLRSRTHFRRYRGRRVHFSCFAPRTRFRRYRRRRVSFSCFALPESFSTVTRAPGPFFLFCAHRLVFSGSEGVGSRFHV